MRDDFKVLAFVVIIYAGMRHMSGFILKVSKADCDQEPVRWTEEILSPLHSG